MRSKIKDIFLLVCTGVILVLLPVFLSRNKPIQMDLPILTPEEAPKEAPKPAPPPVEQQPAPTPKINKLAVCEEDEDCIIVDQDPCGCLSGPEGVTAINALYTLEFNEQHAGVITKACPDVPPSTERECSEMAQAVCINKQCKIVY